MAAAKISRSSGQRKTRGSTRPSLEASIPSVDSRALAPQPAAPANGEAKAIGQRLRELRRARSLTLKDIAEGAGLAQSFISQIEAGAANPSIASLQRIGKVLGLTLAELFNDPSADADGTGQPTADEERARVVRKDQRRLIRWPGSAGSAYLLTPDLRHKLEVFLNVREPGHTTGEEGYTHEGEEFGLILEGSYEVTVKDDTFVLEEGDAIYFSSRLPHRIRVLGRKPGRSLWVVTPPSF